MQEKQMDLLILACSLGFRTISKENQVYLTTIHNNQTVLFPIDTNADDMLMGKDDEILAIIDERLGIHSYTKDLKRRYESYYDALSNSNHHLWDKIRSKM